VYKRQLFERQAARGDTQTAITYKKLARLTTPTPDQTLHYAQFVERSNPKDAAAGYRAAFEAFNQADRRQEALNVLKRLAGLDPTPANLQQLANFAGEMGHKADAAAAFCHLAELEERAGRKAAEFYERAYSLDPANSAAALGYARSVLDDPQAAINILGPLALAQNASDEFRQAYGRALVAAKRPVEAEPIVWELFQKDPRQKTDVTFLLSALIEAGESAAALALARKLEHHEKKERRTAEFIGLIKQIADAHPAGVEFLEYLAELFSQTSRESDYEGILERLFDLYYAAGNFRKAGECLERSLTANAFRAGLTKQLEMLRDHLDAGYWSSLRQRFPFAVAAAQEAPAAAAEPSKLDVRAAPTMLEDFIVQAEIFLQYGMPSKARERAECIQQLFPREEEKNERLRQLFLNVGFAPRYAAPAPAAAAAADDFEGVAEVSRKISRQGNAKGVVYMAVNEVGRHWNVSRCVGVLGSPGKSPSLALEYCAKDIKQSDGASLVKLITAVQAALGEGDSLAVHQGEDSPALAASKTALEALGVQSLLAISLKENEQPAGLLILEQCDAVRRWQDKTVTTLKTIVDQMALAISNARLKSLMKTLAVTDEKSGLMKRSSYTDFLIAEVRRALKNRSTFSVMLMQMGKPRLLARTLGEQGLESLMQQLGQAVCSQVRQSDVGIRYDASAIAVLLSGTDQHNAMVVEAKLRKAMAAITIPGSQSQVPLTIAIAEAVIEASWEAVDMVCELINRAETALEMANAQLGQTLTLPPGFKPPSTAPAQAEIAVSSATVNPRV